MSLARVASVESYGVASTTNRYLRCLDSDGYRRDSGHVCTDTGTSTARSFAVARPLPGDLHGALREGVSPGSRGVLQVDPSGLAVRLLKHRFEPSEEPFANAVVISPPPLLPYITRLTATRQMILYRVERF